MAKKRPRRATKPESERKSQVYQLRLTRQDHKAIHAKAAEVGKSVAQFVREQVFRDWPEQAKDKATA